MRCHQRKIIRGKVSLHTLGGNNDSNNKSVDTNDTSHDHRDNAAHHKLRAHDSHGGHTNAALCGSISSTKALIGSQAAYRRRKENVSKKNYCLLIVSLKILNK